MLCKLAAKPLCMKRLQRGLSLKVAVGIQMHLHHASATLTGIIMYCVDRQLRYDIAVQAV